MNIDRIILGLETLAATQPTGYNTEICRLAVEELRKVPTAGTLTMWAFVWRDDLDGVIKWVCEADGDKGDHPEEPVLKLRASAFPVGTKLQIWEPDTYQVSVMRSPTPSVSASPVAPETGKEAGVVDETEWPVSDAYVAWYQPQEVPTPGKIIDASLYVMDRAEIGDRYYSAAQVREIVASRERTIATLQEAFKRIKGEAEYEDQDMGAVLAIVNEVLP